MDVPSIFPNITVSWAKIFLSTPEKKAAVPQDRNAFF
jgi:hypothetical protein